MPKKQFTIIMIVLAIIAAGVAAWVASTRTSQPATQPVANNGTIPPAPAPNGDTEPTTTPEVITSDIDTSDWKTYRNEALALELIYPKNWKVEPQNSDIFIVPDQFRTDLPEGGGVISISLMDSTLAKFIKEYNAQGPFSQVTKQEDIIFNEKYPAKKLTASTDIGIDTTYIYVERNGNRYLFKYHNFDLLHLAILDNVKFISEGLDISDWKTYRNEELGFEVEYPTFFTTNADGVFFSGPEFQIGVSITRIKTSSEGPGKPVYPLLYSTPFTTEGGTNGLREYKCFHLDGVALRQLFVSEQKKGTINVSMSYFRKEWQDDEWQRGHNIASREDFIPYCEEVAIRIRNGTERDSTILRYQEIFERIVDSVKEIN